MRSRSARGLSLAGAAGAGVYAWWATGVPSFTAWSYLAVAIPAALVFLAGWFFGRSRGRRPIATRPGLTGATVPWAVLAVAAVALESVGLALGGRSRAVPTLSDVADRLIAPHPWRALAFLAWLAVGVAAVRASTHPDVDRR